MVFGSFGWPAAIEKALKSLEQTFDVQFAENPADIRAGEEDELVVCLETEIEMETGLVQYLDGRRGSSLAVSSASLAMVVSAGNFFQAVDTLDELEKTLLSEGKASIQAVRFSGSPAN